MSERADGAATAAAPQQRRLRPWMRAAAWSLLGAYFVLAAFVLGVKYWVLPDIGAHSARIEQAVSSALGARVSIGRIDARWSGLHAELDLGDVRLHDAEGRVALQLPGVQAVIGWRSIPLGSLRLHSLVLQAPDLQVRRDVQGRVFVAGMALDGAGGEGGSAWVLSQPEIVVRGARLAWDDEMRGAPTLALSGVDLVIENNGDTHRFSLRATAAPELASTLDLRGALEGDAAGDMRDWRGKLFAQVDYVDLAAWQQWVDYPVDVRAGRGALRVWASVDQRRLTRATVDVALAEVRARVAEDLPYADLERLRGRLTAGAGKDGISVSGRSVELGMGSGAALPPADFDLRWQEEEGGRPARGEFQASALALEPLAHLAGFVPLPPALRARITEAEPRGTLRDFKVAWSGDAGDPRQLALKAHFTDLAVKKYGDWGGFSGATGTLEASESGGTLRLGAQNAMLEPARWLPGERLALDSLIASVDWSVREHELAVTFSNVAVSGKDLAGTLRGSLAVHAHAGDKPASDVLDLTGSFTRIDAQAVYRYIPHLPRAVADYLKASVDGGALSDARLRIKGDLHDFPFADGKTGTFQASARIASGDFEFSDKWPRVTGIAGELHLEGARLQVLASRAAIMGARVSNLRAHIPDWHNGDELVRVEGTAEGPVSEFLHYIEASPVAELTGGFTRGMSAGGAGRLQLALDLPVRRVSQAKVAGSFQFSGGPFTFDPGLPPLAQLTGRLEFTEDSLSGRNLSAQFLGGPATFSIATRPERSFSVTAQGTANVAALQKAFDLDWLQRASGSAAWSGSAAIGPGRFDLVVDSPLAGVSIALPAPLGKRSGETLALKVERSTRPDADILRRARAGQLPAGGDAIAFTAGKVANGVFVRRRSSDGYALQRGAIGINEPAPPPEESGLALAGSFGNLDLDRWLGDARPAVDPKAGDARPGASVLRSVRLSAGALSAGGRRFNDVRLRAVPAAGGWSATVSAAELEGTLNWQDEGRGQGQAQGGQAGQAQGQGRGKIVARLKRFTVPGPAADPPVAEQAGGELPALDIVAEDFVLGDMKLGRLEVLAINEARNWKIDRLLVANADSRLSATGLWQSWATRPSIGMDLKLEVMDAGSFLNRVGFPETMRGGTALLEGKVGWIGGPQSIDYPTLTGEIKLTAQKGQFLRAEPGIAKLLGILSLQSWITLDFREALGEGFMFDTLSSSAKIARGILTTDDFAMSGKSARVTMAGTVDLARETQDLKVRVVPAIGDSASTVAGLLLANPVTALGALLAQRLLKDPLGKIFAVEYTVRGTWSEPKVERVRAETSAGSTMQ
jgi:uncharacterized protein (TIGR02099 family)